MDYKICLHALNVQNKNQLVNMIRKMWPGAAEKSKYKEKYFNDEDFIKYKRLKFTLKHTDDLKIYCISGVMTVNGRFNHLNEILLKFNVSQIGNVLRIIKKILASKTEFVLDEPNMMLRVKQRQGFFRIEQMALYDEDDLKTVYCCHLPLQIYEINKQWGNFLLKPEDKVTVRQLRVRIRRLRSSLTLFKPLLPSDKISAFKQLIKDWSDLLGDAREFDVALLTCMKIKNSKKQEQVTELEKILLDLRSKASAKVMQMQNINCLTQMLAEMLLVLYSSVVPDTYSKMTIKSFLQKRLSNWCDKLLEMSIHDEVVENVEELHKIRIKVKRLRYALQAAGKIEVTSNLLRSLKNMQDTLGFIHDNYVNDKMLQNIMRQHKNNSALCYETAMFSCWDSSRKEIIIENLPKMWEDFSITLQNWQEECL